MMRYFVKVLFSKNTFV